MALPFFWSIRAPEQEDKTMGALLSHDTTASVNCSQPLSMRVGLVLPDREHSVEQQDTCEHTVKAVSREADMRNLKYVQMNKPKKHTDSQITENRLAAPGEG